MIKAIDSFISKYSYLTFLISLIFWIGLSPIFESFLTTSILDVIVLSIISISAFYFLYQDGNRVIAYLLIPVSLLFTWLSFIFPDAAFLSSAMRFAFLALFFLITIHLIVKIFKSKKVDVNVIYASIAGYIMIGLMASILCWLVNWAHPNSYSAQVGSGKILDFAYYSFVTMSTLGYGDVTPISEASRSLAIFITLIGQFYMTVLIALLIGKFLSQKKSD